MWKTFMEEFKHVLKHKWRPWEWLVICLIPFFYGFFYMNAYWNPFGHTENLRVAVVNLDKGVQVGADTINRGSALAAKLKGSQSVHAGNQDYKYNIEDASSIYKTDAAARNAVETDKYQAVIIIDEKFTEHKLQLIKTVDDAIKNIGPSFDVSQLVTKLSDQINLLNGQMVTFVNSAKYNYLAGEMTNFGAGLKQLELSAIFPTIDELHVIPGTETFVKQLLDVVTGANGGSRIIDTSHSLGSNVNTYGFGLSPYFMCIALWAGALVTIFLVKNERHKATKNVGTFKHYFGKSMFWVLTAWIQALILTTAITLQGVHLQGTNQWMLYLLALFIATVFTLTVQGVAYAFRYGDMADFAAVILLIIQLISSSGTFPVDMQVGIFKVLHPIVPFTYAISAIRETLFEPNVGEVMKNIGILLAFPAVFISASLLINLRFDLKSRFKLDGKWVYNSFEIHLGDH